MSFCVKHFFLWSFFNIIVLDILDLLHYHINFTSSLSVQWSNLIPSGQCRLLPVLSLQAPEKVQVTDRPAIICLVPTDPSRHWSLSWHQGTATKNLPHKVQAVIWELLPAHNRWPRKSAGRGWLPGNKPSMDNLWDGWGGVSERHRVGLADLTRAV